MRTTVRLSDKLLNDARKKAAQENCSLNAFMVEALEQKVYSDSERPTVFRQFKPKTHIGGLKTQVDLTDNSSLLDLMEKADGAL